MFTFAINGFTFIYFVLLFARFKKTGLEHVCCEKSENQFQHAKKKTNSVQ